MLIRNRACIDLNLNKTIAPSGHSLHHGLPVLSVSQTGSTRERQRRGIGRWEENGLGYLSPSSCYRLAACVSGCQCCPVIPFCTVLSGFQ